MSNGLTARQDQRPGSLVQVTIDVFYGVYYNMEQTAGAGRKRE